MWCRRAAASRGCVRWSPDRSPTAETVPRPAVVASRRVRRMSSRTGAQGCGTGNGRGQETGRQRAHLHHGLCVTAGRQVQVEAVFQQGETALFDAGALCRAVRTGYVGQCLAGPQIQALPQQFAGPVALTEAAGPFGFACQPLGSAQVDALFADLQRISTGVAHHDVRVRTQGLAQPGRIRPERSHRARRRVLAPHRVDQFGHRRDPPAPQQQHGQQRPLLR